MDEQQRDEVMKTIYFDGPRHGELAQSRPQMPPKKLGFKKFFNWKLLGCLAMIAGVVALIIFWPKSANNLGQFENRWQAVFLNNEQVYFGHVSVKDEQELILQDVYYPQKPVPLQQGAEVAQQSDFAIVKFGGEIYGTEDEMQINREMILFVANLKDESKIMQAIKKHQGKK